MLVLIGSFILGAIFVILIELFALYRWFRVQPIAEPTFIPSYVPVSNPEAIAQYCGIDGATDKETCMFLNLVFQFLWREWRDSPKTRNFFIRKMNMEFQEMLLNKAAGKVMEQITVRDYNLGDSLPIFKNVTVMKIDCKPTSKVPREIDLAVDIDYTGGFIISLDVDLIFGKKASMTIRLKSITGRIRLQFTRNPCTHWSFSFYEDPKMDLFVDSNFEGRKLPKLTTFISNQIRKSIKKKHTLPRYKVRYNPFFVQDKPQDGKNEVYIHNSLVTEGKLNLEIVECTRIPQLPKGSHIYCSLTLDPLPWKEDMPMKRSLWPVHEVLMCGARSGSIGVSFNRYFENDHEIIIIKTIKPDSPASHVDIQRGDLLISVNNVDITTMKQAVRLIKNAGDKLTFKLQRPPPIELQHSQFLETNNGASPLSPPANDSIDSKEKKQNNHKNNSRSVVENGVKRDSKTKEDDFDYNSVLVREDEDSDSEEFVNIVVSEISEELSNDEVKRSKFLTTMQMLAPSVGQDSSSSSSADLYNNSQIRIDTPDGKNELAETQETRLNLSVDTLPIPLPKMSNISPPVRRRSLPFFNRRTKSTSNLLNNKTIKSDTENIHNDKSNSKTLSTKSKLKNWLESSFNANNGDVSDGSGRGTPVRNKERQQQDEQQQQQSCKHIRISEPELTSSSTTNQDLITTKHGSFTLASTKCDSIDSDGGYVVDNESESHEWDNISHKNVDIEVESHAEEDKEPTGQVTSLLNANKELVWNESFPFDVEKEHRFLNVCVWCKHEDSFEKDVLLGYISIPLVELAVECLSTSSRKNLRTFHLATTSSRTTISRAYLRTVMPGMNLGLCNGNITLAYQYIITVPESKLEEEQFKVMMERRKRFEDAQPEEILSDQKEVKEHNFVGQEFYFPTRCDYCQNKVWRKVAFQCRVCAMVSHKRCIQKARANTYCTSKGSRARPPKWEGKEEPALATSECNSDINQQKSDFQVPLITLEESYTITKLSSSIKDHEDDLRPGIKNGHSSPNNVLRRRHRLSHQKPARRLSLQDFVTEEKSIESIPEDVEDGDLNDSIATAAVAAKEAGRELYASLDKDGREEGIQEKVRQLQIEIISENKEQTLIRKTLENTKEQETKQKIEVCLRKSEERSQALALLMIQYCSALNECISASEPQHV